MRFSPLYRHIVFWTCVFIFGLALPLGLQQTVYATEITLEWDPNSEPNVAGYRIYYGTYTGTYTVCMDVNKLTTYTVRGLQEGLTYYFVATAYNTSDQESDNSNEVSITTPSSCTFAISPANRSFGASGGAVTVSVTALSECTWVASGSSSWITITSGKSGTGNGTVSLIMAANNGVERVGAITIAGRIFTATQAAASAPTATQAAASAPTVTQAAASTPTATFNIFASAATGGSISPSGVVSVRAGASQNFQITAASRYRISKIIVDGVSKNTTSRWFTFSNVKADHSIRVIFRAG